MCHRFLPFPQANQLAWTRREINMKILPETWYYLALTWNGLKQELFVNGKPAPLYFEQKYTGKWQNKIPLFWLNLYLFRGHVVEFSKWDLALMEYNFSAFPAEFLAVSGLQYSAPPWSNSKQLLLDNLLVSSEKMDIPSTGYFPPSRYQVLKTLPPYCHWKISLPHQSWLGKLKWWVWDFPGSKKAHYKLFQKINGKWNLLPRPEGSALSPQRTSHLDIRLEGEITNEDQLLHQCPRLSLIEVIYGNKRRILHSQWKERK